MLSAVVSVYFALIALLKSLSDDFCNSIIVAFPSNNDCTRFSEIIGFILDRAFRRWR